MWVVLRRERTHKEKQFNLTNTLHLGLYIHCRQGDTYGVFSMQGSQVSSMSSCLCPTLAGFKILL
jgi:hypothetical protein